MTENCGICQWSRLPPSSAQLTLQIQESDGETNESSEEKEDTDDGNYNDNLSDSRSRSPLNTFVRKFYFWQM
jgi:hypothetical protein